jgi:hypothetical protein
MKATPSEAERYLGMISETLQRISLAVKGIDGDQLKFKTDTKAWSANDLLAHLRSCADLWTHSIYAMLAEREWVLPAIDERKWARVTRYEELPL